MGAIAASSREANSVGAVRLTLLPKRLEVELLKSGSYADGYVPGPLTRFVRISAPYTAVRGFVRRGDGVLLSFDSRAVTPHNRFFLTHFSDAPLESLASAYRFRRVLGVLAWLAPLPVAFWLASQAPSTLVSGAIGKAALIVLCTLALGAALRAAVGWTMRGGPLSERLLSTLERRLSQRLGFDAALFHETDVAEVPEFEVQKRAGVRSFGARDSADETVDAPAQPAVPITQMMPSPPVMWPPVAPTIPLPVAPPMSRSPTPAPSRNGYVRAGFALAAMLVLTASVALVALRVIPRAPSESAEPISARAGMEDVERVKERAMIALGRPLEADIRVVLDPVAAVRE